MLGGVEFSGYSHRSHPLLLGWWFRSCSCESENVLDLIDRIGGTKNHEPDGYILYFTRWQFNEAL